MDILKKQNFPDSLQGLWKGRENSQSQEKVNLSNPARVISAVSGGILTLFGLRQKSFLRWPLVGFGSNLVYQGITGYSRLNKMMGIDGYLKGPNSMAAVQASKSRKIRRSITINKPANELYRFWHNFENLPRFMHQLSNVTVLSEHRSRWKLKGLGGLPIVWEAEIINDKEAELIAWQSLPGSKISNAGSVQFRELPGNRGTEIKVEIDYQPPVGAIGAVIASLLGKEPEQQVQESLRNFKQIMEASEIPTSKI